MKQENRNTIVLFGVALFLLTWGILPAFAGDKGYCSGLGQVVTLKQGETHDATFTHFCGCTLKYVLLKPTSATVCSTLDVTYKNALDRFSEETRTQTTSVCRTSSADAEYKFPQSKDDYYPDHATFTCKQGACLIRYGLVWWE